VISPVPITDTEGVVRRLYDAPVPAEPRVVEEFIAGVLRHAHRTTVADNDPDDTRGVLYMTHCFADALAIADPQFDRMLFVRAVTS
jgi:hypothetical protein